MLKYIMPKYPLELPHLSDENDFEKLINKLCQKKYNLDSFKLYGRKGSKQHGIDGLDLQEHNKIIYYNMHDEAGASSREKEFEFNGNRYWELGGKLCKVSIKVGTARLKLQKIKSL